MNNSRPATAVNADVRRINAALIFSHILGAYPCSRKDIRDHTGLVSGTVTAIVNDLADRGLISELNETVATRGRPQRLLGLNTSRVVGVRIIVKPMDLVVDLVDLAGTALWSDTREHHGRGSAEALVNTIVEGIREARAYAEANGSPWFAGTIIAIPGPVADQTTVVTSLALHLRDLNLAREVTTAEPLAAPVIVANDGRLGALAEYSHITAEERPLTMAHVTSSPFGVAGGLIVNGDVFGGEHGLAGEVGHIGVDKNGVQCACGSRGCLTTVLNTEALCQSAGVTTLSELLVRLERNDVHACRTLVDAAQAFASAISTLSTLTDVGVVALGGDLALLYPWLKDPVETMLASRAEVSPVFNPRVQLASLGDTAITQGAWQLLAHQVASDPLRVSVLAR